jgi:hypothetical protein
VTGCDYIRCNKSNHPIQNPSYRLRPPPTRDNIFGFCRMWGIYSAFNQLLAPQQELKVIHGCLALESTIVIKAMYIPRTLALENLYSFFIDWFCVGHMMVTLSYNYEHVLKRH